MARRELRVRLVGVERERARDAHGGVFEHVVLRGFAVDAAEHLGDVDADARYFDADGERAAVAIEDRPALRLDVEAPLALLLRGVAPARSVLDLHAVRARDDPPEPEPHRAAENSHAEANPARALGVEVLHGGGPLSVAATVPSRLSPIPASGTIRSGAGGSMPRRLRATISTRSGVR